jgi:hypothetical protein
MGRAARAIYGSRRAAHKVRTMRLEEAIAVWEDWMTTPRD